MFFSCKCLNIILKYSGRQLVPNPELSFPNHEFFRDNSLITSTADDNFLVLKRQPALIDEQVIDYWNITKCINCYQYTYGISDNITNTSNNNNNNNNTTDNLDNLDNSDNVEPLIIPVSIKYLVFNKSLINVNNLPDDSDNSELSRRKLKNLPDDNFKRSILTKDNSKLSDNIRLVVGDNFNSISDNTIPLINTKTISMTDDDNNSSFINDNSPIVVNDNNSSLISDKTIIFSDNVPLISDNSVINSDNNTCFINSIISIDNSITSCSTINLNDNSTFNSDNNFTLVTDNNSTLLIVDDKSKISITTDEGDNNSTLSGDDDNNSPIENDNSANKNNIFVKMKNHPNFSDIYNIIVDCNNDSNDIDDNEILIMRKQLLPGVQESLGNLHQQYETKVKNIKDTVENNIKQYTAKQYEYLENYKDQGHNHYYILTNKILRNEFKKIKRENNTQVIGDDIKSSNIEEKVKDDKTELVIPKISPNHSVRPITQDNFIVPGSLIYSNDDDNNHIITDGKGDINRKKKGGENRPKRKQQMKNQNGDIYDEVIFPIEGMDNNDYMEVEDNNKASDNEDNNDDDDNDGESDDSGKDEGIHIPRVQRGGHPTLAKSLPVTVPNFGFGRRKQRQNNDQQSVDPQDPHNIRASIKALAKSVHGDTVFGDLPRPRFSTEI